ncbi:MAG: FHA domain-containing protein [Pseudomonadales bacterium]|nr:FHA domain-containing protein [Pseudomonadales bacterium]
MDARQKSQQDQPESAAIGDVGLELHWDNSSAPVVLDSTQFLVVGRDVGADICFPQSATSKTHAHIQWQGTCFMLSDCSTNGSFVRSEDEQVRFLRRNKLRLWGEGSICFNGDQFAQCVVHFKHVSR